MTRPVQPGLQAATKEAVTPLTSGVGHYENFPVASWLCPAALRPAVTALYHFARQADDIADEGEALSGERLADLAAYRRELDHCLSAMSGPPPGARWPEVFAPLAVAVRAHGLPGGLLHDLLSAFEQDIRHTARAHRYADTPELLAYCRLSANPVGRLLLHLYGVNDALSHAQSDAVCSALQLINFWQDIGEDLKRQRVYLPGDALARHGLNLADFTHATAEREAGRRALVAELCTQARSLMMQGAPLARRIPGRAGWELRLVVQGGLRILDKIEAIDHRTWIVRPTLGKGDLPRLAWRAVFGMGPFSRRTDL
jgi:squalene synthase HpnC